MCRWLAYSGSSVPIEALVYRPENSLVVQSLRARMGAEPTNGDGFGVGWYGTAPTPGLFRSPAPAWNDLNLRELAAQISSPLYFAHVRASSGTPVQQTNCHPFRHGQWLWMHNGRLAGFTAMKRDLLLAVDPELFATIEGSTDSEVFFHLALTLGLTEDPPGAVARAVGLIEGTARRHGIPAPVQMTVATTDGRTVWAFRYSSDGHSRTLFHSTDVSTLRHQHPENPVLRQLSDETRIVVSEPLGDLRGAWREVPESTSITVRGGVEELRPFAPA
ncbi:class II glutamine amidotransferase [Nocardioides sp. zg-DK7169]|uniref:class II glutamine amidotransferase n=1 Tax=Nocardioides sp. zg-DK7169 TaxID=2736600 RepID=UPI001557B440|nr:class II glutamine amidotransferase [Nocardioides sp. zg-DK7169]NPC98820.1 class II glutamine amidotransferase [Nocardioides sp. zg-DK7169]